MTTAAASRANSPFFVFRNRSFALLWTAQFVSIIGSAISSITASIVVYRLTGSALSVGLVLMATAAPSLLIGLLSGVFVDRYDRKRIMVAADLIRAVLVALIPLLLPMGLFWLYLLVFLTSAVGQFFEPAQASVLPEVASEEELVAANSFFGINVLGSTSLGFALAGFLTTRYSVNLAFYLDAASFLVSAALLSRLRLPKTVQAGETSVSAVWRNLRGALGLLVSTPTLRSLLVISVPVFLSFGLTNALLLPFARRALGAGDFEYGLMEGLTSVGFVAGSLLMASLADRLHGGQWLIVSFAGMALATIAFGLTSSVPVGLAILVFTGFINAPSYIARGLLVQRNTPREVRGRVNSAFFVARDAVFLVGMAAAGLADSLDVRTLMVVGGIVMLGAAALGVVLPGIGQPAAEWRQALRMLRTAETAPRLGLGRAAVLGDIALLASRQPLFARLTPIEQQRLADRTRVHRVPAGTMVVREGEASDAAFFVLEGSTAWHAKEGGDTAFEVHRSGDFFGEIAALTGARRTGDVASIEEATILQVPSEVLKDMAADPLMNGLFWSKATERMTRMGMVDLPRMASMDQASLRELRTGSPAPERVAKTE